MIDFRYHIVSIVAIFLALAVGIVLGSGPLKDDIGGFLEDRTAQLAAEKVDLQQEVGDLREDVASADEYAALVQPNVVRGLLTDRSVTLVVLPGASSDSVDALREAVDDAGGSVAEKVEITSDWADPDRQEQLTRVADTAGRGEFDAGSPPDAARVLSAALVTDNERLAGQPYVPSAEVMAALAEADFVKIENDAITRGGSVILVGSDTVDEAETESWLGVVQAFADDDIPETVVGPIESTLPGGLVAAVRDSDVASTVSTVDRLEWSAGVTTSILALTDQFVGVVGQYGTGPDTSGPAPDPVPAN